MDDKEIAVETLTVRTQSHDQMVDITLQLAEVISQSGVKSGEAVVFVPHTTAGITVNEHVDPDVVRDTLQVLDRLVPWKAGYRHREGNAASHVKASLMGSSAVLIIEAGQLVLGTWQGVFLCEFDGPRNRKVHVRLQPTAAITDRGGLSP